MQRLSKVTKELNVGLQTCVDFLQKKGYTVEASLNAKIDDEQYEQLVMQFSKDKDLRQKAEQAQRERMCTGSYLRTDNRFFDAQKVRKHLGQRIAADIVITIAGRGGKMSGGNPVLLEGQGVAGSGGSEMQRQAEF